MNIKLRGLSISIFSFIVIHFFVTSLFDSTANTYYWLLILCLAVLFVWLSIPSFPAKASLLLSIFGMLAGTVLIKLGSVILLVAGIILFFVSLFFFAFKKG